jgi:glycosyltransferase involved in cell wall biosynthesis
MQISDVFFHQSYREGLPVSVMEAMYFGLPVVASNIRGNRDLIDNKKGGFLTEPEDVVAQTDAIQKILSDDDLSKQMSQYNKEKVKPFFIENVRQELKDIYTEIGLL